MSLPLRRPNAPVFAASALAALALALSACNNEPESTSERGPDAVEPMDRDALGAPPDPGMPEADDPASREQPGSSMESGSNDGSERAPGANSKLIPADQG